MSIEIAYRQLGWPSRDQILNPKGAGPRVYARLVKEKIGTALKRRPDVNGLEVGVLTANPDADATEAPIAIICEFQNRVSDETLKEAHTLAWNFSRSPLLITVEPHVLRTWTCCEPPSAERNFFSNFEAEIIDARANLTDASLSQQAAESLHWVQFITGQFFRSRPDRFRRDRRADQMLLANLKYIRQKLHKLELNYDCIHDLLARVIFIQFLFQRKDSNGHPTLNASILRRLHSDGTLSATYSNLGEILSNYDDAYRFFRWLNEKFSGDLFPGEGATREEREAEWRAEMRQVTPAHLNKLADFVSGRIQMERGQLLFLWEWYSFDAIPLEFISSIYEVFVGKDSSGVYYTPGFLVDFMLDAVLPWDSTDWDVKILDPACGSGIFLVKAFQRLVHRWRNANEGKKPSGTLLKRLLQKNLFGVDIDPHAVRVASFSLYLALCDEVDPRHLWDRVKFPRLRERQVVHSDFFYEEEPLFRQHQDQPTYDLIIGNAPWGRNSVTRPATLWANNTGWVSPYGDIGPLFLPKAVSMCKPNAYVVMLQPAGTLIYNQAGPAREFRRRLFTDFKVEEVINLSTLRFGLFRQAVSPACVITMRPEPPDGQPLSYICPKSTDTNEDYYRIIIEPHDNHFIYPREAATDPLVWSALIWGGRRDLAFIRELTRYPNIKKLKDRWLAETREGVIRGNRKQRQKQILGRRILEEESFPRLNSLYLSANKLQPNDDPWTDSAASTEFAAFDLPQMLIKQSWQTEHGRFQAVVVRSNEELGGVICSQSYISVHVKEEVLPQLEAACLSYNSQVAVYYLLLTSGRLSSYRPEPLVSEMLNVPIPDPRNGLLQGLRTLDDIDVRVREVFHFKDTEWTLIEDLINYTLRDFKEGEGSPGRQMTRRHDSPGDYKEPDLSSYCDYFLKVIKAGFGQDKDVCATIYHDSTEQEQQSTRLPVRMVAIHLDWPDRERVGVEPILDSLDLWQRLQELNKNILNVQNPGGNGFVYQRVIRTYDTVKHEGKEIFTVYLIKPDQLRYWTRSTALRDADEVTADLLLWLNENGVISDERREKKLA